MDLNEAKELLKKNGYILEDTETNDEEYEDLMHRYHAGHGRGDLTKKEMDRLIWLDEERPTLKDKISNAKTFNTKVVSIEDIRDWLLNNNIFLKHHKKRVKIVNDNTLNIIMPDFWFNGPDEIIEVVLDDDCIRLEWKGQKKKYKTKTLSMTEFDKIWFKLQEDNNIDFDED
jgi:hypothetical protein